MAGGVEQVDHAVAVGELQHRRGDRDAALLLERHPVGRGRAAVAAGLHRAGLAGERAAVEQELLGERGLARVGVADDGEGAPAGGFGGGSDMAGAPGRGAGVGGADVVRRWQVGAAAEQVEAVVVGPEPGGRRPPRPWPPRASARGRSDTVKSATEPHVGADQVVVMVVGEVLGQLEAGELVGAGHPVDHAARLEHGEVAVGRALGQAALDQHLGGGERTAGVDEHLDQACAGPRCSAGRRRRGGQRWRGGGRRPPPAPYRAPSNRPAATWSRPAARNAIVISSSSQSAGTTRRADRFRLGPPACRHAPIRGPSAMSCSLPPDDRRATRPRPQPRAWSCAGGLAAGLAAAPAPAWAGAAGARTPTPGPTASARATDDRRPAPPATSASSRPGRPPRSTSAPIMFPVLPDATLGKATWTDTYLAPRSGGRRHEGQDLMGKKMLKLLAVRRRHHRRAPPRSPAATRSTSRATTAGTTATSTSTTTTRAPTTRANQFKYAFAPGMAVGKRVLKGEHIAYLGDSGNAEATGSHCHFEIRMPNAKWYNAAAVNAKYSLERGRARQAPRQGPRLRLRPARRRHALRHSSRPTTSSASRPSAAWLAAVHDRPRGRRHRPRRLHREACSTARRCRRGHGPVIRLYLGFFRRHPATTAASTTGSARSAAGTSLDAAASQFAGGAEFTRRYGDLDNAGVRHPDLPEPLRHASPTRAALDYWVPAPRRRRP